MYTGELPGDSFNFQVTGNFNLPAGKYDLYCAADDQCGILFAGTNKVGTGITADCGACRDCNGKSAIVDIPAGAQDVSLVFCENSGGWCRGGGGVHQTNVDLIRHMLMFNLLRRGLGPLPHPVYGYQRRQHPVCSARALHNHRPLPVCVWLGLVLKNWPN